jgi:hypothetical protein
VSTKYLIIKSLTQKIVIPIGALRHVHQLRKDTLFLMFEYIGESGAPKTARVLAMPFLPRFGKLRSALSSANPQVVLEI